MGFNLPFSIRTIIQIPIVLAIQKSMKRIVALYICCLPRHKERASCVTTESCNHKLNLYKSHHSIRLEPNVVHSIAVCTADTLLLIKYFDSLKDKLDANRKKIEKNKYLH